VAGLCASATNKLTKATAALAATQVMMMMMSA
jgi:hypothetical protein